MVQVIGEGRMKPRSASQKLGMGLSDAMNQYLEHTQKEKTMSSENEAFKRLGMDVSGITDPRSRQEIAKQLAKMQTQNQLLEQLGLTGGMGPNSKTSGLGLENPNENMEEMEKPGTDNNPINIKVPKLYTEKEIAGATAINPALGSMMQRQNEQGLEESRHQENKFAKDKQHKEKQELQQRQFFHTETKKFDESLDEQFIAAEKKNRALDRQMANVDKIGWWDRTVSSLFGNSKWGDLFRSKTAQEFDANMLPQMEGQRQILGGILSDSDIRLLNQKIVTASKDPGANKTIAKAMRLENDLTIAKKRIGDELKSRNGGYRPPNYKSEIDRIYNERYGNYILEMQKEIMGLPDDKKKLSSIARRKVGPGTVLTPETADMYLDLVDGDLDKASKMMVEDGYDEF